MHRVNSAVFTTQHLRRQYVICVQHLQEDKNACCVLVQGCTKRAEQMILHLPAIQYIYSVYIYISRSTTECTGLQPTKDACHCSKGRARDCSSSQAEKPTNVIWRRELRTELVHAVPDSPVACLEAFVRCNMAVHIQQLSQASLMPAQDLHSKQTALAFSINSVLTSKAANMVVCMQFNLCMTGMKGLEGVAKLPCDTISTTSLI